MQAENHDKNQVRHLFDEYLKQKLLDARPVDTYQMLDEDERMNKINQILGPRFGKNNQGL